MAPGQRKVAFSAKQKKEQLKEKRERKMNEIRDEFGVVDHRKAKKERTKIRSGKELGEQYSGHENIEIKKINQQPSGRNQSGYDSNRYRLHFKSDSNESVEKGKLLSREPIETLKQEDCEIDLDEIYQPGTELDMPKRPVWDYSLSRQALDSKEEKFFKVYLEDIFERYKGHELSYFELNLETWRQLWRVLEMSDIILLISDIRHPALHFSPTLYNYTINDLNKHMILVLNKIDLAPPSVVVAWKRYFQEKFPKIEVVCFTSMPKNQDERQVINEDPEKALQKKRKKRTFTAVGPKHLLQACEKITDGIINLSSWKQKIDYDSTAESTFEQIQQKSDCENSDSDNDTNLTIITEKTIDTGFVKHQQYKDNILTIGCCGYPNVGKSSIINGLMGKKVVSVSKTPGHTKHFQTIFITPNVKLCDSPGLVFPSLVSRPLQILSGIYPISQLREPYTTIRFLAERLPLPKMLKLSHPDLMTNDTSEFGEYSRNSNKNLEDFINHNKKEALSQMKDCLVQVKNEKNRDNAINLTWSAHQICDAWAEKKGFITAKAGRNDVYRAANQLLRLASEGRICLCMKPPDYHKNRDQWENDSETQEILKLQEMHKGTTTFSDEENVTSDDDDYNENDAETEGKNEGICSAKYHNRFDILLEND